MSNDLEVIDGRLVVKLNSEVGDQLVVAVLREAMNTCQIHLQNGISLASMSGKSDRLMEDMMRDVEVIHSFRVVLSYFGGSDAY